MKTYSIKLRGEEVGSISCGDCVPDKDSPDYVFRTIDGKLVGILTPAPGITVEEKIEGRS